MTIRECCRSSIGTYKFAPFINFINFDIINMIASAGYRPYLDSH